MDRNGTSLIELLCAVILVTAVVATLSMTFSSVSYNIVKNRQRWMATQLAKTQLASITGQPYDFVVATTSSSFSEATCSCSLLSPGEWAAFPSTNTQTAGTTFFLATCIHYMNIQTSPWSSVCPGSGVDTGYKQALVRVTWSVGSDNPSVTQESMISRY